MTTKREARTHDMKRELEKEIELLTDQLVEMRVEIADHEKQHRDHLSKITVQSQAIDRLKTQRNHYKAQRDELRGFVTAMTRHEQSDSQVMPNRVVDDFMQRVSQDAIDF